MRETIVFFGLQVIVLLLSLHLNRPGIEEFRPTIISETPTVGDITEIVKFVIIGTVVLLAIRLLKFPLRYFIDFSVLVSGFYLSLMILRNEIVSVSLGLAIVAIRQLENLLLFNLTSSISIVAFSLLFGLFLPGELVVLLLAAMSVYDVIGVFYTKHIKYIWFGSSGLKKTTNFGRYRNTLAILFPQGSRFSLIGAGDFALPLILTASTATQNLVAAAVIGTTATIGFFVLQEFAAKSSKTSETGVPGIPILALFCALGVLLVKAAGLVG